jgi:hypothetical protein
MSRWLYQLSYGPLRVLKPNEFEVSSSLFNLEILQNIQDFYVLLNGLYAGFDLLELPCKIRLFLFVRLARDFLFPHGL